MIKVTFEFASKEEAAAFLGAPTAKKTKTAKETKVTESDDLGEDFGEDLETDSDEDFDLGDTAPAQTKTLKQQIQERAAELAAADKKDAVTAILKKFKEKVPAIKNLSTIPEKLEAKFLEALNKIKL